MRMPRRLVSTAVVAAVLTWLPALTAAPAGATAGGLPAAPPGRALLAVTSLGHALLAPTPPMGFNDWNAFGCDVSATLIEQTADVMVTSGLRDAGYRYVNIDDCWSLRDRDSDGLLVPDPAKFPDGIKAVADYVHGKGLKLGIYGDAGTKTCAGYPGSLGHEDVDARTWADWGVDYLKYDNCNSNSDGSQQDYITRYTAMRQALDRTGRAIVYSICEWGQSQPWTWASSVGDLWRTGGDISDNWPTLRSIIAANAKLAVYAGPGHWNDPDMLEIGNGGMTDTEYRTHLSMWAMMAAPLIIGTDLRKATDSTLAVLTARNVIAIDQDRLGVQGAVVSDADGLLVLDKPLAGGDHALALYNSTDALATISVPARSTGLPKAGAYLLTDVWNGDRTQAATTISAAVPAHGTTVYRVRPLHRAATTPPLVTVGATLGTVIPGEATGTPLTTTVTNRGLGRLQDLRVWVTAPADWTVSATGPIRQRGLGTDTSFAVGWTATAPAGTAAGSYPVTVHADFRWAKGRPGAASSIVTGTVVVPPPDGRWYLSTLPWVSAENGLGPVEVDASNGKATPGDGGLATIGGTVYDRAIGTHTDSTVTYFLGGRCTQFRADVGVDATGSGTADFEVLVDDAASVDATLTADQPAQQLSADLTGARWLRLVTRSDTSGGTDTDWANPVLTCGADPGDVIRPVSRTLFGFEQGTEDFTVANPGDGGTVAQTSAFHTEGSHGLSVTPPTGGNWFGKALLTAPLDLSGSTLLKFDVHAGPDAGTSGEIAIQIGASTTWCQGGLWTWTDAGTSRTVTEKVSALSCPAGTALDLSQVTGFWVFLNGNSSVDNIRAE